MSHTPYQTEGRIRGNISRCSGHFRGIGCTSTTRAVVPPQSGARGTATALRGPEPCRSPVRRLNLPSAQPRTATPNSRRRRLPARAVQAGARRWRAAGTHGRSALRRLPGLAQRVLGCIRAGASCEASQAMDSERIALYQCIVRCVPSAPPATRPRTHGAGTPARGPCAGLADRLSRLATAAPNRSAADASVSASVCAHARAGSFARSEPRG